MGFIFNFIYCGKTNFYRYSNVNINHTTPSTSATTGALLVAGGVGIAGNLNISGILNSSSFANSLTMPGYQKLPGGLIIQWFTVAEGTSQGSVTTNYPIAFPTAFLAASVSSTNTGASSNADMYFQFVSSTTTAITVYRQAVNNSANNGAMIIAIGY